MPAEEITEALNLMCETYVRYAPVKRGDLAQKVSITSMLTITLVALNGERNRVTKKNINVRAVR